MPDVTIDPAFSTYGLVQSARTQRALPHHRSVMLILSHEIENAVIKGEARARIFAGFQWMSCFLPQEERYRKLAEIAETIYVFGVMDVEPPPIANVHYIPLDEGDQLAKEWFLVVEAPDYFSALASEEIGHSEADEEPSFRGIWTFDEDLVTTLQERLSSLVDAYPLGDLASIRDRRRNIGILTNSLFGLTNRLVGVIGNITPESGRMAKDLSLVVQEEIGPAIQTMANRLRAQMPPTSTEGPAPTV